MLDFKNLPEPQNSKEINEEFYSNSLNFDFTNFNLNSENWQNIHSSFTEELQKNWEQQGFDFQQTQDWINIGLTPEDYNLANFLKSQKNLSPEETLNHHNLESLKVEFHQSQQTPQIIHNPPKTN